MEIDMEWEAKKVMCNLGQDESKLDEFKCHVERYVDTFDVQAWDMFLHLFSISEENVNKHGIFLKRLLPRLEAFDQHESNSLSMIAHIRLGVLIDRIKQLPVVS